MEYGTWNLVPGGHVFAVGDASSGVCREYRLPPRLAALAHADRHGTLVEDGGNPATAAGAMARFLAGVRSIRSTAPAFWDCAIQISPPRPARAVAPDPVVGDGIVPHVAPFQVIAVTNRHRARQRSWMWWLRAARYEDVRGRTRLHEPRLTVHVGSARHRKLSTFVTTDPGLIDEVVTDRLPEVWERFSFTPELVEDAADISAFQRVAKAFMTTCFDGLVIEDARDAA